jgi:hypothetical protein
MHTRLVKSDLFSFRAVFGLILLTVLPGCSIPGMPDSELAERLEQNGYSFMPPAETGWFIADRSANRVARSRLTDFVEKRDKRNLPPPRFRLRDYDVSELDIAGAQCALSRIVAEDREPETGTNVLTSMLVETIGTVCIHPSNSDLAITLTLSHRSFPEDQDRAFKAYAQNLLQTQQFSALTTRTPN